MVGLDYLVSIIGFAQDQILHLANDGYFPSYVICILASIALYAVLYLENKRRDALPVDEDERAKLAFQDLTDKENPYFRYVY